MANYTKNTKSTVEDIKDKMNSWYTYWNQNNEIYRECNAFLNGDQWDQATRNYYVETKKPVLTMNILYLFLKQVVGEQIQNLPELEVIPKNMQVEQEKIELLEDLLRTIFIQSGGEESLQAAAMQIMVGFSVLKINTRYTDDDSFQQEIYFNVVNDPTLCGFDPKAVNKCKDDGDYCYQVYFMNKEEWEMEYPDIPWRSGLFYGLTNNYFNTAYTYSKKDICAIADFYVKEYYTKRLAKVSPTVSGQQFDTIEEKDFDDYLQQYGMMLDEHRRQAEMQGQIFFTPALPKIVERRKDRAYKIKCYRIRQDMILDEYDWDSKFLPMVYVPGADYFLNGQWYIKSLTQEAHDLQRYINLLISESAQMIKTARRERIIATPTMMAGFEDYYRNPERNYGVLPFKPDPLAPGGGPELVAPPPVAPDLLINLQWATQQLGNMLGRSEAALGVNPNGIQSQPTSGVAYQRMTNQQNLSSYLQVNNLFMATQKIGEIMLDLIPRIYTDQQIVTTYDRDFQNKQTMINSYNPDTDQVENEITNLKATVVLSPAPNFEMQKQMERDYLTNLFQAGATNPQLFALVADQFAQLSETSITPEIVKRLKTIVPPQALAASEGKPMPPPPPNPMLQLEQQKMQMAQQELQLKQQGLQVDQAKNQVDAVGNLLQLQQVQMKSNAEVQKAAIDSYNRTVDSHTQAIKVMGDRQNIAGNLMANHQKHQQSMQSMAAANQQQNSQQAA